MFQIVFPSLSHSDSFLLTFEVGGSASFTIVQLLGRCQINDDDYLQWEYPGQWRARCQVSIEQHGCVRWHDWKVAPHTEAQNVRASVHRFFSALTNAVSNGVFCGEVYPRM